MAQTQAGPPACITEVAGQGATARSATREPSAGRLSAERASQLVASARNGDRQAWTELVDAYVGLLWIIVRDYRLAEGDASDVVQTTWLRLVENIDRLSDPSRVGAWLTTTARRECLRVLRQSQRTVLLRDWEDMDRVDESGQEPDAELLRAERRTVVRGALAELSPSSQALLELLMSDPPLSYEDISSTLGVPVGSIGPTRGRSLRKLQTLVMARGLSEPA